MKMEGRSRENIRRSVKQRKEMAKEQIYGMYNKVKEITQIKAKRQRNQKCKQIKTNRDQSKRLISI